MKIQLKLWPSVIASLVFILLITLGFWQLHRYHYKKELLTRYQKAINSKPLSFSKINSIQDLRFQHLTVTGHYLNDKVMLLQHRFYKSKVGFDVLTPLKIKGENKVLLINRGWIPVQRPHETPIIQPVKGVQRITGYVKILEKYHFTLGNNILDPSQWPLKMQSIDFKNLSRLTHLQFYPFVLRLDPNQPHGFVRKWKPINMIPERHLGYAVQWFTMALALVIAFFFFCRKKED